MSKMRYFAILLFTSTANFMRFEIIYANIIYG